jgi:hypothetical protein
MHVSSIVVALVVQAYFSLASPLFERAVEFYSPLGGGGSMLDDAGQ